MLHGTKESSALYEKFGKVITIQFCYRQKLAQPIWAGKWAAAEGKPSTPDPNGAVQKGTIPIRHDSHV